MSVVKVLFKDLLKMIRLWRERLFLKKRGRVAYLSLGEVFDLCLALVFHDTSMSVEDRLR